MRSTKTGNKSVRARSAKARPKRRKAVRPTLDWDALTRAAECLKVLAHPARLRMVQMLLGGRYSVGELAEACAIQSHMASEHLRLLQRCGFLGSERQGKNTFYSVAEPHLESLMACIENRFGGNSP